MKKLCYFFVLSVLASCNLKSRDSDIFNGEIINIEDKNVVEKDVEFRELELKGIGSGFFSVGDTLAIYMEPQFPSHWYRVFSLNTGEELGNFAMKGNGHGEFGPVGPIDNVCVENNELKTLIFEANKERVHLWNITKSLAENTTVIERVIRMPWRKETEGACYNELFMKDRNTVYAKVQTQPVNEREATLPYYQIINLGNGESTSEIHVFKKNVINKKTECLPEAFFDSYDVMKPDGTRIAEAMLHVPQLNIIDTESKKIKGYLLDYDMSLSDMEVEKELKAYFVRICADDNYIYTSFKGDSQEKKQIYVFDWAGHPVSRITTKHIIDNIAVDKTNKILYTTSPMDEKLYYIKTEELTNMPCHP